MKTGTLFFTIISAFFALRAADDRIITLQSNDGQHITIPTSVAQHSQTLANIIGDCPVNQTVPVPNFDAQELSVLVNILNTIHQATSDENAIASLRCKINPETKLTLSYLDCFFDIPMLQKALIEDIAATIIPVRDRKALIKRKDILDHKLEQLLESCDHQNNHNGRDGIKHLIRITEDAKFAAKKLFLKSKGEIVNSFYTGASVGELADHGLIDIKYKPHDTPSLFSGLYMTIDNSHINSLEGLVCTSAPNTEIKRIDIDGTCTRDLPANIFQRVQDPSNITIIHTHLTTIHPEAFAGLHVLKELYILNFEQLHIPLGAFDPLISLEKLSLHWTSFDTRLLKYCVKLKKLNLYYNDLNKMPSYWPKACASIKKLSLYCNNIQNINPASLAQLPELECVSFSNNKLSRIHVNMFKDCKKLKKLKLEDNPIPQQKINALRAALPKVIIEF